MAKSAVHVVEWSIISFSDVKLLFNLSLVSI